MMKNTIILVAFDNNNKSTRITLYEDGQSFLTLDEIYQELEAINATQFVALNLIPSETLSYGFAEDDLSDTLKETAPKHNINFLGQILISKNDIDII